MELDRVHGDVERRRDLLVRQPIARELRHALLGRRQLAGRPGLAGADALELGARLRDPAAGTLLLEERDGAIEGLARGAPFAPAALGTAECEQRSRGVVLQPERLVPIRGRSEP